MTTAQAQTKKRAVIYMRVSTEEQVKEGYSLASQRRRLLEYINKEGWDIVGIYADEGISGKNIKDRKQATQLLNDAKKRMFDIVTIIKVDRLARNTRNLLEIVDVLQDNNVILKAIDEPIDVSTPLGYASLTMAGMFAQLERSTITQRMKSGKEEKIRNGEYLRFGRLFGYDFVGERLVQNTIEANIIREWYSKIRDGKSLRSLFRDICASKILTAKGNYSWSVMSINRILRNPLLAGSQRFGWDSEGNECVYKIKNIDPIMTEHEWQELQIILKSRAGGTQRKWAAIDHTFADVVYCQLCSHKMRAVRRGRAKTSNKEFLYYECFGKNQVNQYHECSSSVVKMQQIEEQFLSLMSVLQLPKAEQKKKEEKNLDILFAEVDKKILQLTAKKQKLIDMYLTEMLDKESYAAKYEAIENEFDILSKRRKDLLEEQSKISTDDKAVCKYLSTINMPFVEFWTSLEESERREFVVLTVEKMFLLKNEGIVEIILR